jgi:hypothetical protein
MKKKKAFKVVYALSYEIDACSAEEAESEAAEILIEDVYNAVKYNEVLNTFASNVEDMSSSNVEEKNTE